MKSTVQLTGPADEIAVCVCVCLCVCVRVRVRVRVCVGWWCLGSIFVWTALHPACFLVAFQMDHVVDKPPHTNGLFLYGIVFITVQCHSI